MSRIKEVRYASKGSTDAERFQKQWQHVSNKCSGLVSASCTITATDEWFTDANLARDDNGNPKTLKVIYGCNKHSEDASATRSM